MKAHNDKVSNPIMYILIKQGVTNSNIQTFRFQNKMYPQTLNILFRKTLRMAQTKKRICTCCIFTKQYTRFQLVLHKYLVRMQVNILYELLYSAPKSNNYILDTKIHCIKGNLLLKNIQWIQISEIINLITFLANTTMKLNYR